MTKWLWLAAAVGVAFWLYKSSQAQAALPPPAAPNLGGTNMGLYDSSRLTAEQQRWANAIADAATAAGLDPAFMIALAISESSLDPQAVGDNGQSFGLFQLQVKTAHSLPGGAGADAQALLDGALNIQLAVAYMNQLMAQWPGYSWGDYAEAWTLGGHGRFDLGRRNPGKVAILQRDAGQIQLALNLEGGPTFA
jgi:soluble lytic murein transglycosylase-like protein